MRRSLALVVAAVSASLASCGFFVGDARYVASAEVYTAYQQTDKNWSLPRTPLSFDDGRTVNNCAAYTQAMQDHRIEESVSNAAVRGEYLVCDALSILRTQQPPRLYKRLPHGLGQSLASRLDLRSLPSSLFNRLDESRHTLNSMFGRAVRSTAASAEVDNNDLAFKLEVVAVVDADGNQRPDWVVWVSDESKDGNYRGYDTVLVMNVAASGPLRASPLYK